MFEFIFEFERPEFELILEFIFELMFVVDIGVEVDIGVAFVMIAVFEFAFRMLAFTFTFVSPQDVSANNPAATTKKYPVFLFIFRSPQELFKNRGRLRPCNITTYLPVAAKHTVQPLAFLRTRRCLASERYYFAQH